MQKMFFNLRMSSLGIYNKQKQLFFSCFGRLIQHHIPEDLNCIISSHIHSEKYYLCLEHLMLFLQREDHIKHLILLDYLICKGWKTLPWSLLCQTCKRKNCLRENKKKETASLAGQSSNDTFSSPKHFVLRINRGLTLISRIAWRLYAVHN